MELRNWDIGSPEWIKRVNARLDRLVNEIEAMPRHDCAPETPSAAIPAARSEPVDPTQDMVERRIRRYLYPPTGISAALD